MTTIRPAARARRRSAALATVIASLSIVTAVACDVTTSAASASTASVRAATTPAPSPAATPTTALLTAPTVPPIARVTVATVATTRKRTTKRVTTRRRTTVQRSATTAAAGSGTATTAKPVAFKLWTVQGAGSVGLAVREAPAPTAVMRRRLAEGTTVRIVCQITGTSVRDASTSHASSLWDGLSSGGYIAHLYTSGYDAAKPDVPAGLATCSGDGGASTSAPAGTGTTGTAAAGDAGSGGNGATGATTTTRPGVVQARATVATTA